MSKTTTYRQKSINGLRELVLIPAAFDLPLQKHGIIASSHPPFL